MGSPPLLVATMIHRKGRSVQFRMQFAPSIATSSLGDGRFDLMIFGFCLYLVDPRLHLRCVAEADRVVADGGLLAIHDSSGQLLTIIAMPISKGGRSCKMEFSGDFLASPAYRLLRRRMSAPGLPKPDHSVGVDLLSKNLAAAFPSNPFV